MTKHDHRDHGAHTGHDGHGDRGRAIGAGTDVAVEAGDVILVRSYPRDVPRIVKLSRASYRNMVQNLWWAAGYNIGAIPLAARRSGRVGNRPLPSVRRGADVAEQGRVPDRGAPAGAWLL
jgi:hypothetical protein